MYIIPHPYKCIKCGYEQNWSPHEHQTTPMADSDPVCPQCWSKFLKANLGIMYCTVNWRNVSDYDKELAKNERTN